MTTAGDLRHRIAFDKQTEEDSSPSYGITLSDWEEQFIAFAQVIYRVGSEPVQAQRLKGVQPLTITVRSNANTRLVDASWRARDARTGAAYQIRAVTPDAQMTWIEFLCEAGVANG